MGLVSKIFTCGILFSLVATGFAKYCGIGYECPNSDYGKVYTRCCSDETNPSKCCLDYAVIIGPVVAGSAVATIIVLIGVCMCCRLCPCCECCKRTPCYTKEVVRDRERDGCLGYVAVKIVDRDVDGSGERERIDIGQHSRYGAGKPLVHQ